MGFVAAKCPSCGANIQIAAENDRCFCSYCGAQILTEAAVNFARVQVEGTVQTRMADFDVQAGILRAYHGSSTDVVIPEGVHTIDSKAFRGLPLTSVTLPASIQSVRFDDFRNIKTLRALYYANNGNDWTEFDGSLYSTSSREYLFYPPADPHETLRFGGVAKATISNNPYLKNLVIEAGDTMPDLYIENCEALENLELPATGIIGLHLKECPAICSITFPNFVQTIEISYCKSLERIDVLSALDKLVVSGCPLKFCNSEDGMELPEGTVEINLSGIQATRLLVRDGVRDLKVVGPDLAFFELAEGPQMLRSFSVDGARDMHVKLPSTLTYTGIEVFHSYDVTFDYPNLDTADIHDTMLRRARSEYWKAHGRCYYCGGRMKGLMNRRCSSCGKPEWIL